jgi:Zn-finger nucleic acid-binding protein
MPVVIRCCPQCGSRRVKRLTRFCEAYCPRCKAKFSVKEEPLDMCTKCNAGIIDSGDYRKVVLMGSNKLRHIRCPRKKRQPVAV